MSKDILLKILGLLILALGEFFSIYAEMLASKHGWTSINVLIKPSIIVIVGGMLLMFGYLLSYMYFKNIWIVTVISFTSILIIEPILAWGFFHEIPTTGPIVGFVLGALGMLATIFL